MTTETATPPDASASGLDPERLLDNAATCSQVMELLRDDDGEDTPLRECVRLSVVNPYVAELDRLARELAEARTIAESATRISQASLKLRDAAEDELARAYDTLELIAHTPVMPFPDPEAHSWRAYAELVFRAWCDTQRYARAFLARAGGK